MIGVAVACLGITPLEAYDMTPVELYWALKAWSHNQEKQMMNLFEQARWMMVQMWGMQGKALKKGVELSNRLVPLPWDKVEHKQQSLEEMKEAMKSIASQFNKKNKPKNNKHHGTRG